MNVTDRATGRWWPFSGVRDVKLTAQEEYGLRCLMEVARRAPPGSAEPLSIRDVAAAEGLSVDYAAKLLRVLRQGGLVESERGSCGGYRLAAPAEALPLSQVMRALDTPIYSSEFCGAHSGLPDTCVHHGSCQVSPLWKAIDAAVSQVLSRMTLADLLRSQVRHPSLPPAPAEAHRGPHEG